MPSTQTMPRNIPKRPTEAALPGLTPLAAKHLMVWAGVIFPTWTIGADIGLFSPHTMFGIVGPVAVIVVAGFFTIRSNVAKIWRENYEAEVERTKMAQQDAKEQREAKDAAVTESLALRLELSTERAKPDLADMSAKIDSLAAAVDNLKP